MLLFAHRFASPLGDLLALVDDTRHLHRLDFVDGSTGCDLPTGARWSAAHCAEVAEQLGEYFRGSRRAFTLATSAAGTRFQRDVWRSLEEVPFGSTISYGELARRLECRSARAVGRAVGSNPIAMVVPCHRVIGTNGTLTGYAGGIERKRSLLALEGVAVATGAR